MAEIFVPLLLVGGALAAAFAGKPKSEPGSRPTTPGAPRAGTLPQVAEYLPVKERITLELPEIEGAAKRVQGIAEEQKMSSNTNIQRILDIVRRFISEKRLIIYGGTAINALLPPEDQFYDYSKELPDYDFYSPNAQADAKELADILFAAGFKDAQARSGVHEGTYKVSADFTQVADITQLPREAMQQIDSVEKGGLLYAGPMWLRIDMYKQLTEIKGQQDRWPKVWKRLQLLNSHYPIGSSECPIEGVACAASQCASAAYPVHELVSRIVNYAIAHSLVFVGGLTAELFRVMAAKTAGQASAGAPVQPDLKELEALIESFGCLQDAGCLVELFSEKPLEDMEALANELKPLVPKSTVRVVKRSDFAELFADRYALVIDKQPIVEISKPLKCYGIVRIPSQRGEMSIGTLDTVLTLMFAKLFLDSASLEASAATKARYLCMLEFLVLLAQERADPNGEGVFARFPVTCYGTQHQLVDIFRERWQERVNRLILEHKGRGKSSELEGPLLMYRPNDYELVKEGMISPRHVGYRVFPERSKFRRRRQ